MRLRRKLAITFGALAFMALLIVGVTLWANARYREADEELERHYTRSLAVQRVRAATFRAFKELPDAVFLGDRDARAEFERLVAPARADFERWARLADTEQERTEVTRVRRAAASLAADARRVFRAVEGGRTEAARRLAEGTLEQDLAGFERLTDAAVAEDQRKRQVIRADVAGTRSTGQLVLLLSAFGAISAVLLLGAYLSADLFRPLGRLREGLDRVSRGDREVRLDEGRHDELGEVQRSFDAMVGALATRESLLELGADGDGTAGGDGAGPGRADVAVPSRVALHRLVQRLRARVAQLDGNGDGDAAARTAELDELLRAVGRMTELGFPLDLDLARVDVRALLHDVLDRFRDELVARAVGVELAFDPAIDTVLADRPKLREVLGELVRNALDALPERGGRLGLRARAVADEELVALEVADDGPGVGDLDELLGGGDDGDRPLVGLPSSRAIVEQHGGRLELASRPGAGTLARVLLPAGGA